MRLNTRDTLINYFVGFILFTMIHVALSTYASANQVDADLPVNIEADTIELHDHQGMSIYKGNVRISQGSRKITGKTVKIYSKNNAIEKVEVSGSPATFRQLNDDKQEMKASSLKMEFTTSDQLLVLTEQAILENNTNILRSERIIYDVSNDVVLAGNQEDDNGRVKITIRPDNEKVDYTADESTGDEQVNPGNRSSTNGQAEKHQAPAGSE